MDKMACKEATRIHTQMLDYVLSDLKEVFT